MSISITDAVVTNKQCNAGQFNITYTFSGLFRNTFFFLNMVYLYFIYSKLVITQLRSTCKLQTEE